MNSRKQNTSCEEARQMDMVNYLSALGYEPARIRNFDYWYFSPLRDEKTPSFKINRKLNKWFDHGLGRGGNLIDFGILYYDCTVREFLQKTKNNLCFQKPIIRQPEEQSKEKKLIVLGDFILSSFALLHYLNQRRIPIDIADHYCREVRYELNNKIYYGIGFKNNSDGYEIRNPYFKASSAPKDITTFNNGAKEAAVFEGFTDFLSFMAIHQNQKNISFDFVILNSVSLFEKARPFMEMHDNIRLYLDRDATGQNCSRYALSISNKYRDESHLYQLHKDLNDWLVNFGKAANKI